MAYRIAHDILQSGIAIVFFEIHLVLQVDDIGDARVHQLESLVESELDFRNCAGLVHVQNVRRLGLLPLRET